MRIYLDHNATSPLTPAHWAELTVCLGLSPVDGNLRVIGNPSSPHEEGRRAQTLLTEARRSVAASLGVTAHELTFTGSATESNNTVMASHGSEHVISGATEHPSIREPLLALSRHANDRSFVTPKSSQLDTLAAFVTSLREDTSLCTLMSANNETGHIYPTRAFGDFLHELRFGPFESTCLDRNTFGTLRSALDSKFDASFFRKLHFHVDGTQSFGKAPSAQWLSPGVDSVSVSAHKLGGLTGAGALVLRRGRNLSPLLRGGGQERVKRAGTENLPGFVSLGLKAAATLTDSHWDLVAEMRSLASVLENFLRNRPEFTVLSDVTSGLPNTVHAIVDPQFVASEDVLIGLDLEGVAASSGSACSSSANRPSAVIEALLTHPESLPAPIRSDARLSQLGPSDIKRYSKNGLRFSLGLSTTRDEVHRTCSIIERVLERLANPRNHR